MLTHQSYVMCFCKFCEGCFGTRWTALTTSEWSPWTPFIVQPNVKNKATQGLRKNYRVLLWGHPPGHPPATKNKERASSAVFMMGLKTATTTKKMLAAYNTGRHIKTQLIHQRHTGHLGHFLSPKSLCERSCSQILIPLVWSQRKCSVSEKWPSQSLQRSTAQDGE